MSWHCVRCLGPSPLLMRHVVNRSARLGIPRKAKRCLCVRSLDSSNKPEEVLLSPASYQYILQQTSESQVLRSLREKTLQEWPNAAKMQVSPEQGRFLGWLVEAIGAKNAIEVGTFTGYSAICIAKALQSGGQLVAIDYDERPLKLATQAFQDASLGDKIRLEVGPAPAVLDELIASPANQAFDFAFVDADKRGYAGYHEQLLQLMRPGGVIVYDNMLWYGSVANAKDQKKTTVALRRFSEFLLDDSRVSYSLIPIGDGLGLCRKQT